MFSVKVPDGRGAASSTYNFYDNNQVYFVNANNDCFGSGTWCVVDGQIRGALEDRKWFSRFQAGYEAWLANLMLGPAVGDP